MMEFTCMRCSQALGKVHTSMCDMVMYEGKPFGSVVTESDCEDDNA